jgi:hypothetical protein
LIHEDSIVDTCNIKFYSFSVSPGTTGVRITLAWDDVAADAALAALAPTAPRLVNDLDLILIEPSPSGKEHYAWRLNQNIKDALGNPILDDQEQCGTNPTIERPILPAATPGIPDPIPASGFPAAVRHRDHLNNVEVVDVWGSQISPLLSEQSPVVALTPGTWTAKVIGFRKILGAPQWFSLVGPSFTYLPDMTPPAIPTGLRIQ